MKGGINVIKKFDFHTKKTIAIVMIITFAGLSIYQGVVEKKVPIELATMAGLVIGTYFQKGNQKDGDQ